MRPFLRTTDKKITLFQSLFQGLKSAYGTYDPETGKHWQIKRRVKRNTIYNHLMGTRPYGFYPLVGKKTRIGAVDFDLGDPQPPIQFIERARHYGVSAYLERSKSKGYHVWMFFSDPGISARKVRMVIKHILEQIASPEAEIFPKQDLISTNDSFGNFINAPLFGKFVPEGRTVFIRPDTSLRPFADQWTVLDSVKRIEVDILDSIIELNDLENGQSKLQHNDSDGNGKVTGYALPVCIRRILNNGVHFDQRVACFRIAVHLRRVGLPYDAVVATLMSWRVKNRPNEDKRIITPKEIEEQVRWAFKKSYTGYGCRELVIESFCDPECPVTLRNRS
jgi:hypothetical protein